MVFLHFICRGGRSRQSHASNRSRGVFLLILAIRKINDFLFSGNACIGLRGCQLAGWARIIYGRQRGWGDDLLFIVRPSHEFEGKDSEHQHASANLDRRPLAWRKHREHFVRTASLNERIVHILRKLDIKTRHRVVGEV